MNVLLIVDSLPPVNKVSSRRAYQLAKFFTLEGHKVHIVTSEKGLGGQNEGYERELSDVSESVTYLIYPGILKSFKSNLSPSKVNSNVRTNFQPKKSKLKALVINWLKTLKRNIVCFYNVNDTLLSAKNIKLAKGVVLKNNIDVVFSSYSPSYTHKLAGLLKKDERSLFWIADYRDLWSLNHNILYSAVVRKLLIKYENHKLKGANLFTSVSSGFISSLKRIHGDEKCYHLLPNGFDEDDLYIDPAKISHEIKEIFETGKILISYTGSLYEKHQDVSCIFKALDRYSSNNLAFIFAGHDLKSKIHYNGNSVYVFNNLNSDECNFIVKNSNFLLVVDWDGKSDGVIPAKIFDYMATKKRIILQQSSKLDSELKEMLFSVGYDCALSTVEDWLIFFQKIDSFSTEQKLNRSAYSRHNQVKQLLDKVSSLNV